MFITMDEQALRFLLKEYYDALLNQITTCFVDLRLIYVAKSSGVYEKRKVVEETTSATGKIVDGVTETKWFSLAENIEESNAFDPTSSDE